MRLPAGTPSEGRTTAPQAPQPTSVSRAPDTAVSRSAASSSRPRPGPDARPGGAGCPDGTPQSGSARRLRTRARWRTSTRGRAHACSLARGRSPDQRPIAGLPSQMTGHCDRTPGRPARPPVRVAATVLDLATTPTLESACPRYRTAAGSGCSPAAPSNATLVPPRGRVTPAGIGPGAPGVSDFSPRTGARLRRRGHVSLAHSLRLNTERIPHRLPCS
jgi:hypothetical protein